MNHVVRNAWLYAAVLFGVVAVFALAIAMNLHDGKSSSWHYGYNFAQQNASDYTYGVAAYGSDNLWCQLRTQPNVPDKWAWHLGCMAGLHDQGYWY